VLLLGLDTATAVTTVALVRSGPGTDVDLLAERSHLDPRRHGEVLPMQIDEVLRESGVKPGNLDAIAVGIGPGAFTGLRVGLATAEALGLALQIPVYGANTLDVLAFATKRPQPFGVLTDARRRELFWATYDSFDGRRSDPVVGTPEAAHSALAGLDVVCPPGTPEVDGVQMQEGEEPSAVALCLLVLRRLATGSANDLPAPLYLRRPDVMPAAGPKSVLS
jgi:tRNA threonylcarbamoyl adenosine modification protein YeaZ